ncbi:MAG: metal ABC transporter substrate-binding protein [Microbacteriaceae bacterium]
MKRNQRFDFRSRALIFFELVLSFALVACSTGPQSPPAQNTSTSDTSVQIFATTGYLADAAKNIAPNANVRTLVGPGGDPHTYQPSTRDIQALIDADLVLWNGLHLEAQMLELLEGLGEKQLGVGELLDPDKLIAWTSPQGGAEALHDPHIWNSPELWRQVVLEIAKKLGERDPDRAKEYLENAAHYNQQILEAENWARDRLAKIPDSGRILITGHDAFNYFGQTFNLEIYATDFISTDALLSPTRLSELATLIAQRQVPVIFRDNQANPQAIQSLKEAVQAESWTVKISEEELYADTLGVSDPGAAHDVGTYIGALKHNVEAVANALGVMK